MGNNYSDLRGTSKTNYKVGKVDIDASAATAPRTLTVGDNNIDFSTATTGQYLKKTGANSIGFADPAGLIVITGPSILSGLYDGDVLVDCNAGDVIISGNVTIKGDLRAVGTGTYNIGTPAATQASTTIDVYGDIHTKAVSIYCNSAPGSNGSQLNVYGSIHVDGEIQLKAGTGASSQGVYCTGDINVGPINVSGGDGTGSGAGNGGTIQCSGTLSFSNLYLNGGNEYTSGNGGAGGLVIAGTLQPFNSILSGVAYIYSNGGAGTVVSGNGGSVYCQNILNVIIECKGGLYIDKPSLGGSIYARYIGIKAGGIDCINLSGVTGGSINADEIFCEGNIDVTGFMAGNITARKLNATGNILMNATNSNFSVTPVTGGNGGNAQIDELICSQITLNGSQGTSNGGDAGVITCDSFKGVLQISCGTGPTAGSLQNSKVKSSSNLSEIQVGYYPSSPNANIYLGGFWNTFDQNSFGSDNTNFSMYVLEELHFSKTFFNSVGSNIDVNIKTFLDNTSTAYRRCFFSWSSTGLNYFRVEGSTGYAQPSSLYMSIGGSSSAWYETIMTSVP